MLEKAASEDLRLNLLALKALVDQSLRDLVANLTDLRLRPHLEYALLSPGKRLRPIMLLLSTKAIGGETEKAIPLALSIETLHAATLVHDDVIDQDQYRRGVPTVHRKWSISNAILVGDALISLSVKLAADYGSKIVRIIAETGLALSEGEFLEISAPLTTITEAQYFAEIRGKSAALFKTATQCGALAGGGSPEEVEALAEFGERFGLVYQIRDDIEDLKRDEEAFLPKGIPTIPSDLRNGIPTLPIIHLYLNGCSKTRSLLERSFGGNVSSDDYRQIITELEEHGSVLYCEQRILENVEAACSAISVLKPSQAKDLLLDIFRVIIPSGNIPRG